MKCILCPRPLAAGNSVLVLERYNAHAACALRLSLSNSVVRLRIHAGRKGAWKAKGVPTT
jgi:hypothetical protein